MSERFREIRIIKKTREVKRETRMEIPVFISVHQINFQCSRTK